eukprot:TRINITY_DN2532_c0_g1_i3.p1 TRINITY_DN2532_c0_g1~~TRINITY_DN2532_c0_g1_i3.p1  ORF type:complete len:109 (-),score=7.50 TRINITY_DN2532_c0_g1_i3:448-774(-)
MKDKTVDDPRRLFVGCIGCSELKAIRLYALWQCLPIVFVLSECSTPFSGCMLLTLDVVGVAMQQLVSLLAAMQLDEIGVSALLLRGGRVSCFENAAVVLFSLKLCEAV